MRRLFLLLLAVGLFTPASAPSQLPRSREDANAAVRAVLSAQTAAWNRGDIPAFMSGYWRSDQTQFLGANGITLGWTAVRDRYLRNYPNRAAMGTLTFSDLQVQLLCSDAAYVVGHFRLDRSEDHPQGVFSLLFRRFPDGWKIISDHTSAAAAR